VLVYRGEPGPRALAFISRVVSAMSRTCMTFPCSPDDLASIRANTLSLASVASRPIFGVTLFVFADDLSGACNYFSGSANA
jgi:hypothetical protein